MTVAYDEEGFEIDGPRFAYECLENTLASVCRKKGRKNFRLFRLCMIQVAGLAHVDQWTDDTTTQQSMGRAWICLEEVFTGKPGKDLYINNLAKMLAHAVGSELHELCRREYKKAWAATPKEVREKEAFAARIKRRTWIDDQDTPQEKSFVVYLADCEHGEDT